MGHAPIRLATPILSLMFWGAAWAGPPPTGGASPAQSPGVEPAGGAESKEPEVGAGRLLERVSNLASGQRDLFWKVTKGELCPCEPKSLARCIREDPCPEALRTGGQVLEWISKGFGYDRIVDELIAYTEARLSAPKTFDLHDAPCLGPGDAEVTVVEFSDFECPFCRKAAPMVHEVAARPGVRVCFKHFPISYHPAARFAAEVAVIAARAGKFWDYHDRVFTAAGAGGLTEAKVRHIASSLGLKLDEGALAEAAKRVDADKAEGKAAEVEGTPSFYVNGRPLPGKEPLAKELPRAIEDASR